MLHEMQNHQLMQLFEQLMHTANCDPRPEIQMLSLKTAQVVSAYLADSCLFPVHR